MKTIILSAHANAISLDNITMDIVGFILLGVVSGLIVFFIYQHQKKKNLKG
jgi:hypothetical protein